MAWIRLLIVVLLGSQLIGCATSPPGSPNNICDIFEEKRKWYGQAKDAEERWNSPVPIIMAFMYQESRFDAKAKPPRKKILWIIPGPRLSSAYGYSQAKKDTWEWYQRETGRGGADRDDFDDAADFIGWYNARSQRTNNIGSRDAYNLYLAYHEGHGGFARRTYDNKDWLRRVALKVSNRSQRYTQQLTTCEEDLKKSGSWWWPF